MLEGTIRYYSSLLILKTGMRCHSGEFQLQEFIGQNTQSLSGYRPAALKLNHRCGRIVGV